MQRVYFRLTPTVVLQIEDFIRIRANSVNQAAFSVQPTAALIFSKGEF
jgi:hypothetical protein